MLNLVVDVDKIIYIIDYEVYYQNIHPFGFPSGHSNGCKSKLNMSDKYAYFEFLIRSCTSSAYFVRYNDSGILYLVL